MTGIDTGPALRTARNVDPASMPAIPGGGRGGGRDRLRGVPRRLRPDAARAAARLPDPGRGFGHRSRRHHHGRPGVSQPAASGRDRHRVVESGCRRSVW